jgi:LPS export ABC transporter protein LptC
MTPRKKKLLLIQTGLLFAGLLIILLTYYTGDTKKEVTNISKETKENFKSQSREIDANTFSNIEYTGLDLAGNRYILRSEEAYIEKSNQELVNMKLVHAIFYFKDDTVLNVWSEEGLYNNKTLDITFEKNVEATYEKSKLFAQKANYSNSKSFLTISEKVKVEDKSGSIFADKLLFDIKSKKLNIKSFNNNKVNANINLNEKKF